MKNLLLSLVILSGVLLSSSNLCFNPFYESFLDDTIFIGVAPSDLPSIDGNWEDVAFNTVNKTQKLGNENGLIKIYLSNKAIKDQLIAIFKSNDLSKAFYEWLKPSIVAKWNKLPIVEKVFVYDFISHVRSYLENYSQESENSYLSAREKEFIRHSQNNFWDEEMTKPFPKEICDDWRYFEAFIHRRVSEGISKDLLLGYVNKLLADLELEKDINHKKTKDGQIVSTLTITEGKKEGEWIFNHLAYLSGEKKIVPDEVRNYKSDKKHGLWKKYIVFEDKVEIKVEKEYKDGKLLKASIYEYTKETPNTLTQVVHYNIKSKEKSTDIYENGEIKETKKESL